MTTEAFLKEIGKNLAEISFDTASWSGSEEELYEYQFHLKELEKAGDIKLGIEPYFGGESW